MRTLRLAGTDIETSPLALGCARLFQLPTAAERRRLLDAAFDAGIRQLDLAPMYGLGRVEREVGRLARGRRDRLVIATKFGIDPSPAARALGLVQAPLHRLLAALPAAREQVRPAAADARAGAAGAVLYRAPGYDAAAARASLERSLRALGTDHVDLLFLHDPHPGDVRSDDVCAYLESARAAGRLRAWGVAGEPDAVRDAVVRLGGAPGVVQVRDDILEPAPRPGAAGEARIVFGSLSRALPRILGHVRAGEETRRRWNGALGIDCTDADAVAALLLCEALRANEGGPVVFGSTRPPRVAAAAAAVDAGHRDDVLDALRRLAAEDLGRSERR